MRGTSARLALGTALLCGFATACGSDDDGPTADTEGATVGTGDDDDAAGSESGDVVVVTEIDVPRDGKRVSLQALCFDAPPDAMRSTTPEGLLWIADGPDTWRVLDPLGGETTQTFSLPVDAVQAWTADRMFAVASGELWHVQSEYPQALAWPDSLDAPTQMCGDPSTDANGFVIAQGLHQRDRGQWWTWSAPGSAAFEGIDWLARSAGACIGDAGELWLSAQGAVWRVTADYAGRVETLDGATAAAFGEGLGVAAIRDGNLAVGTEETGFSIYRFEAGEVTAVTGGGSSVWAIAGGLVYRIVPGDALPLAVTIDGADATATDLDADASGNAWRFDDTGACHLRPATPVRFEGVFNLQRRDDEMLTFGVQAPADAAPTATIDDEAIALTAQTAGHWLAAPALPAPGWHTLRVEATVDGIATTRELKFEQRGFGDLTWTTDIEPLFTEHCGGGACHGPGVSDMTRPDLSTYEAWLDKEQAILLRVVIQGDMPPFAVRTETFTLDTVLTIFEWFETGAPQEEQ